jgi:hypothetical protein
MFWLFWQLVGIAVALMAIGAVIAAIVGFFTLLAEMFKRSPAPCPVPSNVLHRQIVEPTPGRTIHFAKCSICDVRFEDLIADEARRMRQKHMKRLHGL